jgi:hypothetical protein
MILALLRGVGRRFAYPRALALGVPLFAFFFGLVAAPRSAAAADEYVARPITLPRHNWAFDFGLGVGHYETRGPDPVSFTGPGLNFDLGVGVTSRLELGFRGGVRLTDDARVTQADRYGRLFDTVTFGTGGDTFSNPEFRITGAILNAEIVEIALEGRVVLPFEHGTRFGGLFGVPFLFHIPRIIRLDTGVYIAEFFYEHNPNNPNAFYDQNHPFLVAPGRLWFQVSDRVWLGPMAQVVHNPFTGNVALLLGFGLGVQLHRIVDFKTQFYFPNVNRDAGAREFGVGAGVEIRIE